MRLTGWYATMAEMRGARLTFSLFALAFVLVGSHAGAETPIPPTPDRWLTDQAAFLSPATVHDLDGQLSDYEHRTGHQVLVYIGHTTSGEPIEAWAARTFRAWKIGRKGVDDGVALFIFSDDHRLRIEVGYGLESVVPDVIAARIINDIMVPRIRRGDGDSAVSAGVNALLSAIDGSPPAAAIGPTHGQHHASSGGPSTTTVLLTLLFFALPVPLLFLMVFLSRKISVKSDGGDRQGISISNSPSDYGSSNSSSSSSDSFSGGGGESGGGGASGSW